MVGDVHAEQGAKSASHNHSDGDPWPAGEYTGKHADRVKGQRKAKTGKFVGRSNRQIQCGVLAG